MHGTPALLLTGTGHQLLSCIIQTHHPVSPVLWQVIHTRNLQLLPVLGRQQRCSTWLISGKTRWIRMQVLVFEEMVNYAACHIWIGNHKTHKTKKWFLLAKHNPKRNKVHHGKRILVLFTVKISFMIHSLLQWICEIIFHSSLDVPSKDFKLWSFFSTYVIQLSMEPDCFQLPVPSPMFHDHICTVFGSFDSI